MHVSDMEEYACDFAVEVRGNDGVTMNSQYYTTSALHGHCLTGLVNNYNNSAVVMGLKTRKKALQNGFKTRYTKDIGGKLRLRSKVDHTCEDGKHRGREQRRKGNQPENTAASRAPPQTC